ncbi:MAG: exo-alpha-sialidase [Gemmatimonadetes bacterium]|nr:exo-alpha-sialidase [Gemmatimonadota bacterium]
MRLLQRIAVVAALLLIALPRPAAAQLQRLVAEDIFPVQDLHVHGSTIEELSNGDLLVAWFQGHGERWADDVRIMGARRKAGSDRWSEPFLLADVDGFPDINPVLFVDKRDRLWLLWYAVLANQWETSLLKYRVSDRYLEMTGAPTWDWQDDLLVKPGDKAERGIQPNDRFVQSVAAQLEVQRARLGTVASTEAFQRWSAETMAKARGEDMLRAGRLYREDGTYEERQLGYPYFQRMGWQTRNKPVITRSGRMILPLYSDGFSFSLMAYTDDRGATWQFSTPLVGAGNIQPAIAQTRSGELVAYMRDNGPAPKRLHVSRSSDDGKTWSTVVDSELPNSGSAADVVTLRNGHWVMIYNDVESGRHRLSVSLSEDEGKTWPWTRRIELDESPRPRTAHYPAIIEGRDGKLHATYSFFYPNGPGAPDRKTVKHATFDEAWIRDGR